MIVTYRPADTCEPGPCDPELLAEIRFGVRHARAPDPRRLTVGLVPADSERLIEVWQTEGPLEAGWAGGIGYVEGPDRLLAHCLVDEEDPGRLEQATDRLYSELLALIRRRGFPYLLRIWNLVASIHEAPDGLERYRAFSKGRARALDRARLAPQQIPAASAVGSFAPGLLVYLLASRRPGVPVENPRQLPAYRYPAQYGPRPPYFARATRIEDSPRPMLLISGTASIVGHLTRHPGDAPRQLEETLRNLEALVQAAGMEPGRRPGLLKVYLRSPALLQAVVSRLRDWAGPDAAILPLQGEICRPDLEVEIEGLMSL